MNKVLPYLLGALLLVGTGILLFRRKAPSEKKVSTWITLSKTDKNPYGTYVFYNSLKNLFPRAKIVSNSKAVYNNPNLKGNGKGKIYMLVMPFFEMSDYDLERLMSFVEKGNTVFISAFFISIDLQDLIDARAGSSHTNNYPFGNSGPFIMKQTLQKPAFKSGDTFAYPGQLMEGYFFKTDSTIARPLTRGNNGHINFVQLKRGSGNLFVHLSPMSFSNYFLLYKDNHRYVEQIFSLLPEQTGTIIWDEYYTGVNSRNRRNQKPNWLASVMKEPAFRAGILLFLFLLLLYAFNEMRRRQRMIPVIKQPVNDSLEFVKTMGLLYYQRKDHQNLAQKMSAYFLEHIRGRYRIFAKELNEDFIKEVSYKSGVEEPLVSSIIQKIRRVNDNSPISETDLITLQRNIETFYDQE